MTSINIGDSALNLRSQLNKEIIAYESDLFGLFATLKQMPTISDRLPVHAAFHERLIFEVNQALEDLDILKEIEWGRQKQNIQRMSITSPITIVNTGENWPYFPRTVVLTHLRPVFCQTL